MSEAPGVDGTEAEDAAPPDGSEAERAAAPAPPDGTAGDGGGPAEPATTAAPPRDGVPFDEPPPLPTARELISVGLDLAFRSSHSIRNASLAIGLQLLAAAGPFVLLVIVIATKAPTSLEGIVAGIQPEVGSRDEAIVGSFGLAAIVAALAFGLLTFESRIVATGILGGQAARRPLAPHEALRRSRQVFWRVVVATAIVQIPLTLVSAWIQAVVAPLVGDSDQALLVIGLVVSTLLTVPFAYLLTGIVLGGASPAAAIGRSFALARVRWSLALVCAIADALAQTLLILGLGAGLGIVDAVASGLGLGVGSGPVGTYATLALALLGTAAVGSLVFTVAALAAAPQVVAFVGLTRYTAALDGARDSPTARRARWVSLPMAVGIVIALLASLAGVSAAMRPG